MTRVLALVTFLAPLFSDCSHGQSPQPRLRVLTITGGDFHDFWGNSQILLAGVGQQLQVTFAQHFLGQTSPPRAAAPLVPSPLRQADVRSRYDAILMYTQGDNFPLDAQERGNLIEFVRQGGGFVGLHCAADTFKQHADYMGMLGGRFVSHPPYAAISVRRLEGEHPLLASVVDFTQNDEFYYLADVDLTDTSVVLLGAAPDGRTRPLAWTRSHGEGRVFYTSLGHGAEMHQDVNYQRLIANALRWVTAPRTQNGALSIGRGSGSGIDLLDEKSIDAWRAVGAVGAELNAGVLTMKGGDGVLWRSDHKLRDFVLEVEWRAEPGARGGIAPRLSGAPAKPAEAEVGAVLIHDAGARREPPGSIAPARDATSDAARPTGRWNRMVVTVIGSRRVVELNGTIVGTQADASDGAGCLGLVHRGDAAVQFRRLRVEEIE